MAEQTLLQIVQFRCRMLGLAVPSVVVTSTDYSVLQLWDMMNQEVEEHCNREYNFPRLKITDSFTYSVASGYRALQLSGVAGLRSIIPRTLWNFTTRIECSGPVTEQDWAAMLSLGISGTVDYYRVVGDWLLIYPGHVATSTYTYEYQSYYGVQATALGALKEGFTVDTDVPLMPSRILKAGLEWRWRQKKGQPYAEEMETYEKLLAEEANRESIPGDIDMGGTLDSRMAKPGLMIATGSWNLP